MAILDSFAFIGIEDFVIKDKTTKAVHGTIPYSVSINLKDEQSQEWLRGGLNNPKIMTFYGDRDTQLELTTATMSPELIKILSNNDMETKQKEVQQKEDISVAGGKFTLGKTPVAGITPSIYKIDAITGKLDALKLGSPSTNQGDFSISAREITCHSSVTKIRVYYGAIETVNTIEARDKTPRNYEAAGLVVVKEVGTDALFTCQIDCPNISILPSFNLQAKNESGVPDSVSLTIDLLTGDANKPYPYSLDFVERIA